MTVKKCMVCTKDVDWELVKEDLEYVFEQADGYGMASLDEAKQHVVEGRVCSSNCYETL